MLSKIKSWWRGRTRAELIPNTVFIPVFERGRLRGYAELPARRPLPLIYERPRPIPDAGLITPPESYHAQRYRLRRFYYSAGGCIRGQNVYVAEGAPAPRHEDLRRAFQLDSKSAV